MCIRDRSEPAAEWKHPAGMQRTSLRLRRGGCSLRSEMCIRDRGNVHLGSSALLGGRVDNGLAVNDTNLAAGYNVVERNIRDRNCDGSAQQSNNLRGVVIVVLQNGADDGNVVAQVLWEQRTHRTVDLTRGQDRLLGRTALTAVSYTHLDVYKRQITHRFGRWRDKLLGKQSEI